MPNHFLVLSMARIVSFRKIRRSNPDDYLMKLDYKKKDWTRIKKIYWVSGAIYLVLTSFFMVLMVDKEKDPNKGLQMIYLLNGATIGVFLVLLLTYLQFKKNHQDIAFLKDGIEWPDSTSLGTKILMTFAKYSEVKRCYIGTGVSKQDNSTNDYFFMELKHSPWKYFVFAKHLDIDRIRGILTKNGVKFEIGTFELARKSYLR